MNKQNEVQDSDQGFSFIQPHQWMNFEIEILIQRQKNPLRQEQIAKIFAFLRLRIARIKHSNRRKY